MTPAVKNASYMTDSENPVGNLKDILIKCG